MVINNMQAVPESSRLFSRAGASSHVNEPPWPDYPAFSALLLLPS